jgi:hypothetical protein
VDEGRLTYICVRVYVHRSTWANIFSNIKLNSLASFASLLTVLYLYGISFQSCVSQSLPLCTSLKTDVYSCYHFAPVSPNTVNAVSSHCMSDRKLLTFKVKSTADATQQILKVSSLVFHYTSSTPNYDANNECRLQLHLYFMSCTNLGYGLGDRGSRVRFPAGGTGNFSLRHRVQNGSGVHPASYPMGTRGSLAGGKAAEAWSSQLTSI